MENYDTSEIASLLPFHVWVYNGAMDIVNFPGNNYSQVGASGACPHCSVNSLCNPVASTIDNSHETSIQRVVSAARCQACKKFVLVVGRRELGSVGHYGLEAVYPMGRPNDSVDATVIPPDIAADFSEAIRCQWIKAG